MFRRNAQSFFRRLWENLQQCCCGIGQQREWDGPPFANPMYSEVAASDPPPSYTQLAQQQQREVDDVVSIMRDNIARIVQRDSGPDSHAPTRFPLSFS
ncbi:MAG: hypothetical protein V4490_02525 [Pseudomonadota bacterium]